MPKIKKDGETLTESRFLYPFFQEEESCYASSNRED